MLMTIISDTDQIIVINVLFQFIQKFKIKRPFLVCAFQIVSNVLTKKPVVHSPSFKNYSSHTEQLYWFESAKCFHV